MNYVMIWKLLRRFIFFFGPMALGLGLGLFLAMSHLIWVIVGIFIGGTLLFAVLTGYQAIKKFKQTSRNLRKFH